MLFIQRFNLHPDLEVRAVGYALDIRRPGGPERERLPRIGCNGEIPSFLPNLSDRSLDSFLDRGGDLRPLAFQLAVDRRRHHRKMSGTVPVLILVHVKVFSDGFQRDPLVHHGAYPLARDGKIVDHRLEIFGVADRAMRRDNNLRLQRNDRLQLLQHSPGRPVAIVGTDIRVALLVRGKPPMEHAALR